MDWPRQSPDLKSIRMLWNDNERAVHLPCVLMYECVRWKATFWFMIKHFDVAYNKKTHPVCFQDLIPQNNKSVSVYAQENIQQFTEPQ